MEDKIKQVKGEKVFFYNIKDKSYYKLCKSMAIKNPFEDIIHFHCQVQKCEFKYDHADIVAVNSEFDKDCKTVYVYELVPKGKISKKLELIHSSQLFDKWITKNKLLA
jgi:hypothetical protein